MNREDFLKTIQSHIDESGLHITVVKSSENPRYAYTIGNLKSLGYEIVLAGAENFLYDELKKILNDLTKSLKTGANFNDTIEVLDIGKFKLAKVHESWMPKMMLGVFDYYEIDKFKAYQILPDESNYAKDIPIMSQSWTSDNIIWKWLDDEIAWDLPVPKDSKVITEVDVLLGEKITEVMRWEDDEWEAFTQNAEDVDKENIRVVPIATILGIDGTLNPILNLNKEKGLWRKDENSEWNDWG